jgi:putative aldouronate transport system permease protein
MSKIYKTSIGSRIFDTFNYLMMFIFSFLFLYPILYVFSVSISNTKAVALEQVVFFPVGFDFNAYSVVFRDSVIITAYKNTIIYSFIYTFIVLLFTAMTAFPLSNRNFHGRKGLSLFFLIPMFVNAGMIPFYLLIKNLGLINSMWSIIIPGSVTAWNLIIFRTYFESLPNELRESAVIDGANQFRLLLQIILPLSKPIIATIALFSMVSQWNNFLEPMLFLNDQNKWTLQLALRKIIINNEMTGSNMMQGSNIVTQGGGLDRLGFYEALKMAAIMVSIGPIVLVYPFAQKYFVKGLLIGSIKG